MNQSTYPGRKVNTRPLSPEKRAEKILYTLIAQTSQAEYDDITVDRLIKEYQRLVILKQSSVY